MPELCRHFAARNQDREWVMALSKEMRLLLQKWRTGQSWPKRLDALEIDGLRGWSGQRVEFQFPIVALVGENGVGKSTVLQAAASIYKPLNKIVSKSRFASTYFPDTPWEHAEKATIKWWVKEGQTLKEGSIRKFPGRWRGNPERRERHVENIDLSRIQPFSARVGYMRLAKSTLKEASSIQFDKEKLESLSEILGKSYEVAAMSATDLDKSRHVPVISHSGTKYSGFHSGAGETTIVELLRNDIPSYSLVLIDEIESSLHPRAQRRLVRHLAEICRVKEIQLIISTHSPYVLEELPEDARLYIWEGSNGKEVIKGISPHFAMTKMDLEQHPECDIYVEDSTAVTLVRETLVAEDPDLLHRCLIAPYGAASVGQALGQMAIGKGFPRPTCVFLDGDQPNSPGCEILPGGDAPERVVFEALRALGWQGVASRLGRKHSDVVDACEHVMTIDDHHEWIATAADRLMHGGEMLWQALCSIWAAESLSGHERGKLVNSIRIKLA